MWEEFGSLAGAHYLHAQFPVRREPTGGTSHPRRPLGWRGSFWLSDNDNIVVGQLRKRRWTHLWIGKRHYQQVYESPMQSESTILVQADTDEVVAETSGHHSYQENTTVLALRRGPTVSYPVLGAGIDDCVMVAQDSEAHALAYFRMIREQVGRSCEIVVPPGLLGGDDLVLVLLLGGTIFRKYFQRPGGGVAV